MPGPVSRRRPGPAPRPHARTAGGRRAEVRRRAVAAFAFALLPLNLIADHFMGTPLFSSKEELRQSGITLRTDHWWRLAGCIAYFVGARPLLKLQLRSKVRMAKQKFDYDGWTVASLALSGISAIATVIQTIAS
ncbi:hypothetical protein GCM10012289_66430 [Nonomuraea cavernae]|uniref:Uncharacterized protein n=1 Tax=Nonomuraea cavernae TaxID=2045107 RepID=A0A918DQP0_9ACTN|nr:hypothetical protein GCM10012289_66430 [Nonomuraea cavernae]